MSTCPVFWRTPMSIHSFSSCSGTSSCVSTTIALFCSRAARAFRSSAAGAPGQRTSSARIPRALLFMPDRLIDFSFPWSLEGGQRLLRDGFADRPHPVEVEEDVVDREE